MVTLNTPILPGATVGVLGSGQLGRMFAIAARRMGYRVHTFSPHYDTPTGQVSDMELIAEYEDLDAVRRFASQVSVVTFEFENVPAPTAQAAAERAPVRPAGSVLHTTQHRLREKNFLSQNGFPVTPFRSVRNDSDLNRAIEELKTAGVLKTADFGYDGKGQQKIDATTRAILSPNTEYVYEAFIDFDREVSVVAARGIDGSFVHWGVVENTHKNSILDVTIAPASVTEKIAREAIGIARGVLEALDVVGVLCVEFFLTKSGQLLINELAPRPHNSGHFTFDASVTSQFEQQLRAVCLLPLGSTQLLRPAAMANLLGEIWEHGEPNWSAACAFADVKLHLYGKQDARPGRKMGHLTALADTAQAAARIVRDARRCAHETLMSKSIDDQIARLEALRQTPTPDAASELRKALANKSNVIVSKAAKLAEKLKLKELADALSQAFHRILGASDKGCLAATAIVKACATMELTDEALFLAGAKHIQMEPTWGGSQDVAVELRCESVAVLVRINSRKMWDPLVRLLADKDPQARATAGRALGATGNEKSIALLQFKILIGDKEPSVMGECFTSILALTRSIEMVQPFLDSPEESLAEAAALALGESRLPEAFEALRKAFEQNFGGNRQIYLLAIAMTRHPDAVDYLLSKKNEQAIEALAMYRSDSAVREKVRAATEKSPALAKAFAKHFGA